MSINEGKKKKKLEYFLLPNQYHPMEQISGGSLTQEEIKPIKTVINQSLQSWINERLLVIPLALSSAPWYSFIMGWK